jgi:hypothetical protein
MCPQAERTGAGFLRGISYRNSESESGERENKESFGEEHGYSKVLEGG